MNYFRDEYTAEYNRQRIIEEIRQIRLEEKALRVRHREPHAIFLILSIGMQRLNKIFRLLTPRPEEDKSLTNEAPESSIGFSPEK